MEQSKAVVRRSTLPLARECHKSHLIHVAVWHIAVAPSVSGVRCCDPGAVVATPAVRAAQDPGGRSHRELSLASMSLIGGWTHSIEGTAPVVPALSSAGGERCEPPLSGLHPDVCFPHSSSFFCNTDDGGWAAGGRRRKWHLLECVCLRLLPSSIFLRKRQFTSHMAICQRVSSVQHTVGLWDPFVGSWGTLHACHIPPSTNSMSVMAPAFPRPPTTSTRSAPMWWAHTTEQSALQPAGSCDSCSCGLGLSRSRELLMRR